MRGGWSLRELPCASVGEQANEFMECLMQAGSTSVCAPRGQNAEQSPLGSSKVEKVREAASVS